MAEFVFRVCNDDVGDDVGDDDDDENNDEDRRGLRV